MADDNVVTFRGNQPEEPEDKSEFILICPECYCTTFQVKLSGDLRCAECDLESSELAPQLKYTMYDKAAEDEIPENEGKKVSRFQHADVARSHVVRKVNEWYKDNTLLFAIAYNLHNGTIQWTGVETAAEREWVYRKLEELKRWLGSFDLDDEKPSREFVKD